MDGCASCGLAPWRSQRLSYTKQEAGQRDSGRPIPGLTVTNCVNSGVTTPFSASASMLWHHTALALFSAWLGRTGHLEGSFQLQYEA